MTLNTQYIIASGLQEGFVDTTGAPLSAGILEFFKDQARTIHKNIYRYDSTLANPYVPLPNPLTLSAAGTIQDSGGNDVVPYYYPYDSNGNVEDYYITIKNSSGLLQFTREAWPNIGSEVTPEMVSVENFCPNGQFLLHYLVNGTGLITSNFTQVAFGGYYYNRSIGSTATDYVTFPAFGSAVTNPTCSPQYAARIRCTAPSPADTVKDFGIVFNDVNKFESSSTSPTYYTFSFTAKSNLSALNVDIILVKNFGVGGSPITATTIKTITLSTSYAIYNVGLTFGDNIGKTIGTGTSVSIFLKLPATYAFDVSVTDMMLIVGQNVNITQFAVAPDYEFQYQGLPPPIPDELGNDLYLPIILTPTGMAFNHNDIGKIFPCTYTTPNKGELLCDGTTYYTTDYSSDGIPYSRLGNVIYDTTLHLPRYGTGAAFVTASVLTPNNSLEVSQNSAGAASIMANGAISPGLSIAKICTGVSTTCFGMHNGGGTFLILNSNGAAASAPVSGTCGWSVNMFRLGSGSPTFIQQIVGAQVTGLPPAGSWFAFHNSYGYIYIWFTVDGVGSDPAPGYGSGIRLDLFSSYTAVEIAQLVAQAASGFSIDRVYAPAASSIPSSSYFHLYTYAGLHFVYYFTINGSGSSPAVAGARNIPIALLSTDTAPNVIIKMIDGINKTAYAAPDLRGDFLRVTDNGAGDDRGGLRWSWLNGPSGYSIGSWEFDEIYSHGHSDTGHAHGIYGGQAGSWQTGGAYGASTANNGVIAGTTAVGNAVITVTGGTESRPVNFSVQAVIKY